MNLIFKDNYIHLIISHQDLEKFHRNHEIEESVVLGDTAGDKFIFALRTNYSYEKLQVRLIANELQISLPKDLAQRWLEGEFHMIQQTLDVGEGRELRLRISKDPVQEAEDFLTSSQADPS